MARRNSGPAFNPPSPEPEDRIAMEGDIVCCLGECRQAVTLATSFLSEQFAGQLNQIAVILARIIEPVRAALTAQLQQAQDKTDQVTIALEDEALHQLMLTAAMIQSLTTGLSSVGGPLPSAPVTQPATSPAASGGVAGGALSGAQVAGSLATPSAVSPVAPDTAPIGAAQVVAQPLPLLAPGELPPPPPGLYPPSALLPPVTSATPLPADGGAAGQLLPAADTLQQLAACTPFPVDWSQPLAFLFSHISDPWRSRALLWFGSEALEFAGTGQLADWRAITVARSGRADPAPVRPAERDNDGSMGQDSGGTGNQREEHR